MTDALISAEFRMARRKHLSGGTDVLRRERAVATTILMFLVVLCLILAASVAAWGGVPTNPFEAHKFLDAIARPRFEAAYNEFTYEHPRDDKPGSWSHVQELDVKDRQNGKAVLEALDELKNGLKRAGY
jgi:hypothetical protein